MDEYKELINRLRQEAEFEAYLQPHSANETPKLLSKAADVIEKLSRDRKKGKNLGAEWPSLFECSVCGCCCWDTIPWSISDINFCPNCGADMRGKDNG